MVRLRGWLHRRDRTSSNPPVNTNPNGFSVRFFSYETLRIATNNFSTIVGEGAYGRVFKGVLPGDGRSVAIKALHKSYRDGFLEMVEFMSHLRHINLIGVIGCCVENDEQLLVCEFAENGSVCQKLLGRSEKPNSSFNWERRAAACIGTARGLSYLHHEIAPRIIHCDVKPANIVLDANFNPKIADFDLIHFVDGRETSSNVGIKGTMGYMDPEYLIKGQLTQKVDVYSFGLVMLEIITGRKAVDFASKESDDRLILNWVMMTRKDHNIIDIVDPKLTDFPKEDVERFINVALLCTQSNSEQRPSMFRVVHMLCGGHRSDQEISVMATDAITTQHAQWFSDDSIRTSASMSSLGIISTFGEEASSDGSTSTRTNDGSTRSKGKCCVEAETRSASYSKEEDLVREYFERSMEKIMGIQVARHRRKRAVNKFSEQVSMEVIYPPFLSGEYPPPSRSEY